MKKIVKYIAAVVIIAAIAAAAVYAKAQPVAVAATVMTPHTAALTFTEQGTAVADNQMNVSSTVGGKVTGVPVAEGQTVKKGDVICTLDTADLEYQISNSQFVIDGYNAQISNLDLADQKANADIKTSIKTLEGQLAVAQSEAKTNTVSREQQITLQNTLISQSEADLERSQTNYNTAKQAFDAGIIPQSAYDAASADLAAKQNALKQNQQQLDVINSGQAMNSPAYYQSQMDSLSSQIGALKAELNKSYSGAMKKYYQAQIQQTANAAKNLQAQLDDYTIKAPADGKITALYVKNTNVVSPQSPVAALSSAGSSIEVYVLTNDIDSIKTGDAVSLKLSRVGGDVTLPGKITAIGDYAVSKVSALGVDEQRVKVNVAPDDSSQIKLGYDVSVTFTAYSAGNKITAPKTAIFKANGKYYVWLIKDGALAMREITQGVELSTEYVIDGGLSPGDAIVTDCSADGLKEGVKVKY